MRIHKPITERSEATPAFRKSRVERVPRKVASPEAWVGAEGLVDALRMLSAYAYVSTTANKRKQHRTVLTNPAISESRFLFAPAWGGRIGDFMN
jgi:hypothetical protein